MNSIKHNIRLIHFSRWTRKGFAAFASLGRVIKISFLSTSLIIMVLPQNSQAQNHTTLEQDSTQQLEEVEVTGELTPQVFNELSRIVTVVMPSQISHAPVSSINDVLNNLSQLDLRQRGPQDVQADLSMQGGHFDQVLILLNGVNINNPQTGHHNLDFPISLSQIERIEVVSGSASRIYGPDAYSGAVNIITKIPKKSYLELETSVGDFGLYGLAGSFAFKGKKSTHLLSISRAVSRGYVKNTDFEKTAIFYSTQRKINTSQLEFQTAIAHKGFGAQAFYTPKYPHQYEATKSGFMSLKFKTMGNIATTTTAYFRAHTDRFELFRNFEEAPAWYGHHNYHFTRIAGVNFRAFTYQKHGKTSIGFNLRYENIHSNVLGIPTGDTTSAFLDAQGYYTHFAKRLHISAFAEQVFHWGNFRMAAGALANHFQGDSLVLRFYPGIDASYELNRNFKIMASFNTALRQPSFTDLYYQGPSNIGNPDLLPEAATHYSLSTQWKLKTITTSVSVFFIQGKNTIDWVRLADTLKWKPMNIAITETYGIEGSTNLSFINIWQNQHFIRNMRISLAANHVMRSTGEYLSHYVDDYLKMKVNISATHPLTDRIYASWTWSYVNRNGSFLSYNAATGVETPMAYGAYSIMDFKLSYQGKKIDVYAQTSNVFNNPYYDYGNIQSPGRWFSVGGRWKFCFSKNPE